MAIANDTKLERINLRLRQNAKTIIEHAASIEGKTVSHFILGSALICTKKTIREHDGLTLNVQDLPVFYHALAKPLRFNYALCEAIKLHDQQLIIDQYWLSNRFFFQHKR